MSAAEEYPVEIVREQPDPEYVRGTCPKCGEVVVVVHRESGGTWRMVWECLASVQPPITCDYRLVL